MEFTKKDRKLGGLGKMDIPMISDCDKKISKMYGCLINDGPESGVSFRATYIIDTQGIVRHISINDLPVGRNIDEAMRLVQAFQYTDKYGEVCPAQWNPGDPTMKPDDEDQLAAFWQGN
jgi:peroxiredoxin 2/4